MVLCVRYSNIRLMAAFLYRVCCTPLYEPYFLQHMSWRYHITALSPQLPIHRSSIRQCLIDRTSVASALTSSWPEMWSCPYGQAASSGSVYSTGGWSTKRNGITWDSYEIPTMMSWQNRYFDDIFNSIYLTDISIPSEIQLNCVPVDNKPAFNIIEVIAEHATGHGLRLLLLISFTYMRHYTSMRLQLT